MILSTISCSETLLRWRKKKNSPLENAKALDLESHFTSGGYIFSKSKKFTKNIEMLEKLLSSQGTLTAFINMKIDKYFNMKILNIHNILLAKSLRGFLPILQNIMLMSMECFPTPMDLVGISRCHACPCTTTLLDGLRGCWNVQRQGMLRQIEKKRAQPSSSHTNLNRRGVGRRRVTVELSSFVICEGKNRPKCRLSHIMQHSRKKASTHPFLTDKQNLYFL